MKGDFTRETYDPAKHYRRVLMQQGRVQLDADWNEQTEIVLHYLRVLTRDVIGPDAGPADDCGFEIVTEEALERLEHCHGQQAPVDPEGEGREGQLRHRTWPLLRGWHPDRERTGHPL